MIYKLWDKRIPTLLGISLIAFSVILTSIFIKDRTIIKSNAISIGDPQNITITNISDTSLVISYTTGANVTGSINFGENTALALTEFEDFDREKGTASPRMIHVTTLNNLTPNTKYYFAINSGQTTFLENNVPFEVMTGPIIPTPSSKQTPIKGSIVLPDGSIPNQTIAYLTIKGAQMLSSLVSNDGSYSFDLDTLRSEDLSSFYHLEKDSAIKITIVSDSLTSRVLSLYSQTNPLPAVTLSNNYDFTFNASIPTATASPKIGGFQTILPSLPIKKTATNSPIILVPKKDQSFTDSQPEFRGTSLPDEKVEITIHSSEAITAEVKADKNGNWVFSPQTSLTPGSHTLTIQTKDEFGMVKTITQSFLVYAAENPTIIPTPTLIIIPTVTFTPMPTPDITLINQIPPTGSSDILIIGITAIAIFAAGIVLFLLTRSKTSL